MADSGTSFVTPHAIKAWMEAHAREAVEGAMETGDYGKALRRIERAARYKSRKMFNIESGVLELDQHGRVDASLHADDGTHLLVDGRRCDDAEQAASAVDVNFDAEELISRLREDKGDVLPRLLCEVEVTSFGSAHATILLPLLLNYILEKRQSTSPDELIAVGAAIRKYIAIMPMDAMGGLSDILRPANHEVPLDIELEVAKMIYRNFEVHPPEKENSFPELAAQLLDMAKTYTLPRNILRGKHSAVASLAIEALASMRSNHAEEALKLAIKCQHRWFGEMVSDDLAELENRWRGRNIQAADWLHHLRKGVEGEVPTVVRFN